MTELVTDLALLQELALFNFLLVRTIHKLIIMRGHYQVEIEMSEIFELSEQMTDRRIVNRSIHIKLKIIVVQT